jgi:hypothetical protein
MAEVSYIGISRGVRASGRGGDPKEGDCTGDDSRTCSTDVSCCCHFHKTGPCHCLCAASVRDGATT